MCKTYQELQTFETFEERYRYLRVSGTVGEDTFGWDRYLNQALYTSPEWRRTRRQVILRDKGCDLGIEDREIMGRIYIHHMNPITKRDILDRTEFILNPEYLICVSFETHQALHYGDESMLVPTVLVERTPNDTCPWKV